MIAQNAPSSHTGARPIHSFGVTRDDPTEVLEIIADVMSFVDIALCGLQNARSIETSQRDEAGLAAIMRASIAGIDDAKAALREQRSQRRTEDDDAYKRGMRDGVAKGEDRLWRLIAKLRPDLAPSLLDELDAVGDGGQTYPRFNTGEATPGADAAPSPSAAAG